MPVRAGAAAHAGTASGAGGLELPALGGPVLDHPHPVPSGLASVDRTQRTHFPVAIGACTDLACRAAAHRQTPDSPGRYPTAPAVRQATSETTTKDYAELDGGVGRKDHYNTPWQ